jgi:hypothetical protein
MQNLDPTGEYSDQEVKDALSGASGTRDWAFRYELLDSSNTFKQDIDYVQSCTIDNNALADIKRTAKFHILDTGNINYLKDRIKPYARLNMPEKTEGYSDFVKSLKPDLWYKMDEPSQPAPTAYAGLVNIADGTTYSTFDTAYISERGKRQKAFISPTGDATNRSEFWMRIDVTEPKSLIIQSTHGYPAPNHKGELYFSRVLPTSMNDLELLRSASYDLYWGNSTGTITMANPRQGYYYYRWFGYEAKSSIMIQPSNGQRVFDSSDNSVPATVNGVNGSALFQGQGLTVENGYSIGADSTSGQISIQSDDKSLTVGSGKGVSVSFWITGITSSNSPYVSWGAYSANDPSTSRYSSHEFGGSIDNSYFSAWFSYQDADGNYAHYSSVDFDNSKLIDGTTHHVVVSMDQVNGLTAYVDGALVNIISPDSDRPDDMTIEWNSIDMALGSYSAPTAYLDDASFFFKSALDSNTIVKMYNLGTKGSVGRRGYVEWPQGVFLLSSPTRTMAEGNTVVREVDAYDQLLVLKEDSVDARFTVKVGSAYTDAVRSVLQSTVPKAPYPIGGGRWYASAATVTLLSETTVNMSTANPATNYVSYFPTSTDLVLSDMDISMKVDTANTTANAVIMLSGTVYTPGWTNKDKFGLQRFTYSDGSTYLCYREPGNTLWYALVPWDATNHAYWRITEVNGVIWYWTSSDGKGWIPLRTAVIPYPKSATFKPEIQIIENSYVAGDVVGRFNEVTFNARLQPAIDITSSDLVLPASMEWEPGTSKLEIINDLLSAINYTSAVFDENGAFVAKPYVAPSVRGSEFTYATDSSSVITGDVGQTVDTFNVPNKWILVVSEPERPALIGTYVNSDPMSPTSTVSRGRTIVDYRTEQTAADQVTLDAKAARLAFEASQVYEKISFKTGLMPFHSDSDTYNLIIDGLVVDNKYSETAWSMDLEAGSTMSHEVRRITNV